MPRRRRVRQAPQAQHAQTPGAEQAQQASAAGQQARARRFRSRQFCSQTAIARDVVTSRGCAAVRREAMDSRGPGRKDPTFASQHRPALPPAVGGREDVVVPSSSSDRLLSGGRRREQDAFRREAVALYRGQLVWCSGGRAMRGCWTGSAGGHRRLALPCLTPADLRTLVGDADAAMRIVESDLLTDFLSALATWRPQAIGGAKGIAGAAVGIARGAGGRGVAGKMRD